MKKSPLFGILFAIFLSSCKSLPGSDVKDVVIETPGERRGLLIWMHREQGDNGTPNNASDRLFCVATCDQNAIDDVLAGHENTSQPLALENSRQLQERCEPRGVVMASDLVEYFGRRFTDQVRAENLQRVRGNAGDSAAILRATQTFARCVVPNGTPIDTYCRTHDAVCNAHVMIDRYQARINDLNQEGRN